MSEKIYSVELTKEEMEVLTIGVANFMHDLMDMVCKPFYVDSPNDSHSPLSSKQLMDIALAKKDLDNLRSALNKFEGAKKAEDGENK